MAAAILPTPTLRMAARSRCSPTATLRTSPGGCKSALLQPPGEVLSVAVGEQRDLAAMRSVGVGKIAAAIFPGESEHWADRLALVRHPAVPNRRQPDDHVSGTHAHEKR